MSRCIVDGCREKEIKDLEARIAELTERLREVMDMREWTESKSHAVALIKIKDQQETIDTLREALEDILHSENSCEADYLYIAQNALNKVNEVSE